MKKFLFSIICTLLPLAAWSQLGPQPYAILSDSNSVLTFYYDDLYEARRGAMYVGPFNDEEERDWHNQRTSIISVVFDESFAQYTSLTSTAFWFTECSNLETIVGLSNLNTENVLHMFAMFGGCSRLETIPLENFNTEKVEDMAAMFAMCTNLRHLDLSSFNTSRVTNMQSMFSQCSSLTTIYVSSGWTTANVTESNDMFGGCTSLVGGNGTTFNSNHTDASFAHIDSENDPGYLTGATSGDEPYWQELQYTIEYGTEVMMRARNTSSVDPWMVEELEMFLERADEMYNERTASEQEVHHMIEELNWIIREVEEAMNRPVDSDPEPYAVLSENNTVLTFYYDGDKEARGGMGVGPFSEAAERGWNSSANNITSVYFDQSLSNCTSITSTAFWFDGCTHLETFVGLQNLNTSNVTTMAYMFSGCSALTNLDVSSFNTSNVTEMGVMFSGCSALTNLDVSNFNTSNVTNMAGMFMGCSALTNLNLTHFNTSNVTDMRFMFSECSSLTSLDLTNFNTSNVVVMNNIFEQCSALTTIFVGSGWTTSNVTYHQYMFAGCKNLVGGQGTTYDSSHTDASYAHIDGGSSNPGYLTGANSGQEESWWVELRSTIDWGVDVLIRARNNSNVDPWMVEELEMFLDRGNEMYNEHTAGEEEVRHMIEELNWIIWEIEEAMNRDPDPHAHGDASFDGLTAWVNGSATLDDAFASLGRSEAAKTIAAIVWNADSALTTSMLDGINNPNLLVYVTEASKAPSGIQNLVINGTAEEIVLTDASGNNNFYCPQAFTAQSISYTRNFSQTTQIDVCRGWETISLPFAVQSIRHQTHGALTPFGGGNNGYPFWLRQLSSSGLSRATAIEANRPYLICMPNNTVYPSVYNQAGNITFSATNVTVPVTTEQTASGAGVTLRPAFQQVAQSGSVYALNVGEARGNNPEGSVFEQNYRAIRPFQAYTTHSSGTRFITLQSLGLGGDDTTGIETIDTEEADDGNATWHTLDGRRLEGKPTKKGVYIKDGRKYIIK